VKQAVDQLHAVKEFLEKKMDQSPGEEVSFIANEAQSTENRNIDEAQSAKEVRTECTDEENGDEEKRNKALRANKKINNINDIDLNEVELLDTNKTVENQVANDNREKTWDIKYLENISLKFYIIRYDEK
jgi:hypothetical protein